MKSKETIRNLGIGIASGLLAGVITAIVSSAFKVSVFAISIPLGIVIFVLLSWLISKHTIATANGIIVSLFIGGLLFGIGCQ